MDLHYKQEVTVGALVLAGVSVFVLGTMWLSGKELSAGKQLVNVDFVDVGNMKEGNPVKVSGVQMGTVRDIMFQDVGRVRVTLSLDPRIQPRSDARAELTSIGLVGDVAIVFDPGRAAEPLPAGTAIQGTTARGLMDLGAELGDQAKATMAGLQGVANQELGDELRATLRTFQRLASVYSDTKNGPTAELTAAMTELKTLSGRMDSILASPAIDRVLTNADSATARLGRLTEQYTAMGARLDTLLARVNRGEGTLGRMATDSTAYTELVALSQSLKAFIDDLRRNPGKITVQVKLF